MKNVNLIYLIKTVQYKLLGHYAQQMELQDKDVIKRGITVISPGSNYEPTIGGLTCM